MNTTKTQKPKRSSMQGYEYVKVGDMIDSEDQYYDSGDGSWQPTTNQGNRCNHPRSYRRRRRNTAWPYQLIPIQRP